MATCKATIRINTSTETEIVFTDMEVSEEAQSNLYKFIQELKQDKVALAKLLQAINKTQFVLQLITTKQQGLDKYGFPIYGIPLGNATMELVFADVNGLNYMKQALKLAGVPIKAHNVVVDNGMDYKNSKTKERIPIVYFLEENGVEKVILPKSAFTKYLYYKYITEVLIDEAFVKDTFRKIVSNENIIAAFDLKSKKNKRNKDAAFLEELSKLDDRVIVKKFILKYLFDSYFYSRINGITNNSVQAAVTKMLQYNLNVKVSIAKLNNYIKDNRIDIENFHKQYMKGEGNPLEELQQIIYEHNKTATDKYYLEFSGGSLVSIKPLVDELGQVDNIRVNTRFTSPVVPVSLWYKGFYIQYYQGKFYVLNKVIDNEQDFKEHIKLFKGFNELGFALKHIRDGIWSTYRIKSGSESINIKLMMSETGRISRTKDTSVGYYIETLDIKLEPPVNSDKFKYLSLMGNSYTSVIKYLEANKAYYNIPANVNLGELLDTHYKIDAFLILADHEWSKETPDIQSVIDTIANAKSVMYKAVGRDGDYTVFEKQENTLATIKTVKPIKHDILYITNVMQKAYGININVITNQDIAEGKFNNISDIDKARAFILDGLIYVNIDKAEMSDLLHEYGHLVLGMLKSTKLLNYILMVDKVRSLPDYSEKIQHFRDIGDTRAEVDLQEELLVNMFGKYMGKGMVQLYSEKFLSESGDFINDYKHALKNIFGFDSSIDLFDIKDLNNMTIDEALKMMGSTLAFNDALNPFKPEDLKKTKELRTVTNIIKKLIKINQSDNNKGIKEECNGV